ncbi:FUN14 domain-containing protein [Nitrososphaera sp. AFS]|uniref:FUN14 domain-containing protein n=1 Tax=Nitrososphaera sp. AFS TaxID=2301191 RepID=UPI0013923391|nr:FUN14 domain-containing protein [Nitrososphaera sp. AFS]NAL78546.1 hypothetical protein [Nitrososphaera sp. AFS]
MSIESLAFSAGGGFLFSVVAGYAIKKVIKMVAVVIGLFVIGLSYIIQMMDRCKLVRNRECNISKCCNPLLPNPL